MTGRPPTPPRVRFERKFVRGEGCWNWTAGKDRDGYGRFTVPGRGSWLRAHRFSYELFVGAVPEGMQVLHRCDNPSCVRPDHLLLGVQQDNADDMVQKGRQAKGLAHGRHTKPERTARGGRQGLRLHPERAARGLRNGRHTHPEAFPRGERQLASKLTELKVRNIRTVHAMGCPMSELARHHGVSVASIRAIIHRRTWSHIA